MHSNSFSYKVALGPDLHLDPQRRRTYPSVLTHRFCTWIRNLSSSLCLYSIVLGIRASCLFIPLCHFRSLVVGAATPFPILWQGQNPDQQQQHLPNNFLRRSCSPLEDLQVYDQQFNYRIRDFKM